MNTATAKRIWAKDVTAGMVTQINGQTTTVISVEFAAEFGKYRVTHTNGRPTYYAERNSLVIL